MEKVEIKNLSELKPGDLVKHKSSEDSKTLVVVGNYGTFVTAVFAQNIMNPIEWIKIVSSETKDSTENLGRRHYKDFWMNDDDINKL